ncbi:pre-mRNA-splicing factor CWC25-like protein [Phytophthora infestans T30-4]|uniref:Pre-mRNA-splicing factor CWC25-like protein n=1 Tax=Phytophthora infestans (strain T30-4) TaxID=403677 RepID=D0MR21_PHYIT|nr:pre-mRNA-splicing factor CWC25-like protein [Phytophthora infestans T30-4]EEY57940.1 pre-mRNA-splicing factor CWC25-like protein [Phytophthora infestans T30-4]|eukprot:XP_002909126.1 pre-mRNA-splicing factor CWC25-like protein [Phytophthora infestans T30-4]
MSLAFLSKKSWHTANLRNVEKVWIAEQKHAAEEQKVAELRKNIEEERQLQELRQLQAARGDKSAAMERLDWMYEGPSAAREKTAEEYLLGKEYNGEEEKAAKGDVDLSTTTKYGSLVLTKSALPANDAFQRLNEDPMMLIRKRQQAAREQVLKNPVKMKRIKDEVDRLKEDKKARKKAKKAVKKEKKHARKEEKRRLKRKHVYDSGSEASADENEERADYRHKDDLSKRQRGHGRDRERGRSHSRSKSPRSTSESRRKLLDPDGKYGLISKAGAVASRDIDTSSLGPNAKYLEKARQAKRLEEEERRRKLGKSSRGDHCELTDEEKRQMAQQMVEDAKQRDEYIAKRATLKKDELDKREHEASRSNPEFLRHIWMTKAT